MQKILERAMLKAGKGSEMQKVHKDPVKVLQVAVKGAPEAKLLLIKKLARIQEQVFRGKSAGRISDQIPELVSEFRVSKASIIYWLL